MKKARKVLYLASLEFAWFGTWFWSISCVLGSIITYFGMDFDLSMFNIIGRVNYKEITTINILRIRYS